jgi:uncharacterized protein DUF4160
MSPTIFRDRGYRFYFFSREEARPHVHVQSSSGEAKFWLEPKIELAQKYGLTSRQLNIVLRLIGEHEDEIRTAWKAHFRS